MKLTTLRKLGRYQNLVTGKEYNIWKGTKVGYGIDVIFYRYRNKRMVISDSDFYSSYKKLD